MNQPNLKKRTVYGMLAAALFLAAALMLLFVRGKKTPVFAEFSGADALDGKTDCCLNELRVLDRYAEQKTGKTPAQLFLAGYSDRDETEVLVSLLVEPDDTLYETLTPYFEDGDAEHTMAAVSGYFFCEPLKTHNKSALDAFAEDAAAYAAWSDTDTAVNPIVLRFAGETEAAYEAACRAQNRPTLIFAAVLAVLSFACVIRMSVLRFRDAG